MKHQGMVEASDRRGTDASLLAQQLDGRLASVDYLRVNAWVCLAFILFTDAVLRDLGTFVFMELYLFSVWGETCSSSRGAPLSH